jgi:hypothetical protein
MNNVCRMNGLIMAAVCLATVVAPKPSLADSIVYATLFNRRENGWAALWTRPLSPNGSPTLIYGRIKFEGGGYPEDCRIVASPDGRYVAADAWWLERAVQIFDVRHPGKRKTIHLRRGEEFIGEWAPDGSGILLSRSHEHTIARHDGRVHSGFGEIAAEREYDGIVIAEPSGQRRMLARPPGSGLSGWGERVSFSPNSRLIAIQGDSWLQIMRPSNSAKILFNRHYFQDGPGDWRRSANTLIWLDDNHLMTWESDRLRVTDISKRNRKSAVLASIPYLESVRYSKARRRLYVVRSLPISGKSWPEYDRGLFSVDPSTGHMERLRVSGLESLFKMWFLEGVSSDGKTMIVSGDDLSVRNPETAKPVSGIWAVDLDSGKRYLVAAQHGAGFVIGTFLPGR